MRRISLFLFLGLNGFVTTIYPDARGDELIDKYLNQSARHDAVFSMRVDYREQHKEPVHLEFTWMRKMKQGVIWHLLRMESPPSEKGKLLLVQEKGDGNADYVAYRPNSALMKKVRVSGARNYKYKGLSISVQELIGGELLKYSHQFKWTERLNGVACHVVENRLRSQFKTDSNYSRSLIYLREDNGMPLKWELFGNSDKLEKIIQVEDVKKIDGLWAVARALVEDLKKKGQLTLTLKDVKPDPDLKDQWFTEDYLKQTSK
ncbi:MAG: hypothetical protein DMG06_07655 [Acidobacteria bacterium]|nr:MAG: hypothetical protein DMG06_07655 [Acidobacteriota bacterium]